MTNSQTKDRLRVLHIISGDLWAGAEAQAYTLLTHLMIHCEVYAVLLNEGELAERLRQSGISVTVLDESKLNTLQIFLQLRSVITSLKPNVIHTHRQKENILGALANFTTVRARSIRTVHGAPEFGGTWKTSLQRKIDRWAGVFLQDVFIAVSDEVSNKIAQYFPNRKIHTVYNGVDAIEVQNLATRADFKLDEPTRRHIGIIGRLVPVKRVDIFLELASLFSQEDSECIRFHVIGDGPMGNILKRQAKELGIFDIVKFHGHRSDIPSCIKSLDALIMCSDHEGLPMIALEAMSLNQPIFVSENLSLKQYVDSTHTFDRTNGLLLLAKTLKDSPLEQTGHMNPIFNIKQCAQTTMSLYKSES